MITEPGVCEGFSFINIYETRTGQRTATIVRVYTPVLHSNKQIEQRGRKEIPNIDIKLRLQRRMCSHNHTIRKVQKRETTAENSSEQLSQIIYQMRGHALTTLSSNHLEWQHRFMSLNQDDL